MQKNANTKAKNKQKTLQRKPSKAFGSTKKNAARVSFPISRAPVRSFTAAASKASAQGRRKGGGGRSGRSTTLTPPRKSVWLEYVSIQNVGVATTHYMYPLQSNGVFAVDASSPAGFATTPGFSVLATNYSAYRVKRYKGTITFENNTAVPADTIVCHSNTALGSAAGGSTVAGILQFAANRPKVNTIIPIQATGQTPTKAVHHFDHSIPFITGESINQPGYKSATNTVPAILTYIVFGWQSVANLASMNVSVKIKFLVEFLDYIDTLTAFESEEVRLQELGKPVSPPACAGCRYVASLENIPCPDPQCRCEDFCTNCGYKRFCTANAQSVRCPFRKETIPLRAPFYRAPSLKEVRVL